MNFPGKRVVQILLRPLLKPLRDRLNRNRVLSQGASLIDCRFSFHGKDNLIEIADGTSLSNCQFHVQGNRHHLVIGQHCTLADSQFFFEDDECLVRIGRDTTAAGVHIGICESGSKIEIGDDCMFSANIIIRSSDAHSIIDLATGTRINPAAPVKIGNHVWVGHSVRILKGTTIGDNSIIGIGSILTQSVPPNCIFAGIPARCLRQNITWSRQRF